MGCHEPISYGSSATPGDAPVGEGRVELRTALTRVCDTPQVVCMSDKESPAGWVVQVAIPGQPSLDRSPSRYLSMLLGAPTFKYFNVAVVDAEAAMAATTKHLADPEHREISVVRALSLAEIAVLGLTAGEVVPA